MLKLSLLTNDLEFRSMMEQVDLFLKAKNLPPYARPMHGWLEISSSLGLGLHLFPREEHEPIAGCYTGDDLTIRIFRWFDERYGEKLKIGLGPGRAFILVRDDPWVMNFPKIYGSVKFFISKTEASSKPEAYLRERTIPYFNVLESISDFPIGLKMSLDSRELNEIFNRFISCYNDLEAVASIDGVVFVKELRSDIDAAIQYAVNNPAHYGQSKWASLQATEKAIKAYLNLKNVEYKKSGHPLWELSQLAFSSGLPAYSRSLIDSIQCPAGVRYGEASVSLVEAWSAHWYSIVVCGHIARAIKAQNLKTA